MIELDLKDRRILYELDRDTRQTLKQIGKKVGLGKETVYHRMRALEEQGVIRQYLSRTSSFKLGYYLRPIFLRLKNMTSEIKQEMLFYLSQDPHVVWASLCDGAWDIQLTSFVSSLVEFENFISGIFEKFGRYIADKAIYTVSEITYFNFDFGLPNNLRDHITYENCQPEEISEYERKVIKILLGNARQPIIKMAETLKVSPKNLANTMNSLEKRGLINYSGLRVNFEKLGYQRFRVLFSFNDHTKEHFQRVRDYLQTQPSVIRYLKLIGDFDISILFAARGVNDVRAVLEGINNRFSDKITKRELMVLFEEVIMDYPNKG